MRPDLEKEFAKYWTDRIPGLLEYSRLILNSNTDLGFMLNIFLKDKGRCRIADMGTGVGTIAIEVALMGHEVCAVDNNPEMLEAARGLAREFDAEIARNCLWNLTEPSKAYTKWKELLRPGG